MRSSRLHARRRPLGLFFVVAGTLHFTHTRYYASIVPRYLPAHRELVYASGAAEIAGGAITLAAPRWRRLARWWLTLVLLAVFPANVEMALRPDEFSGRSPPSWLLWARLPLQAVLVAWVWSATREHPGPGAAA